MGYGDNLNLGLSGAAEAVQSASGLVSAVNNNKTTTTALPWEQSNISSQFFQSISIDPSRWDQLLPYRLMVIDSTNNQVVQGPSNSGSLPTPKITLSIGTGTALVDFAPASPSWVMQLPISPQQLSIQDNYSIQTTATLRGILEEHSGVRFKIISAQGSLGVWPQRSSVNKPPGTPGILQSVFGGTISALGSVVSSVSNVINAASGNHPANKPVSLRPETSQFGETSTGYYQAIKLASFLEQYAEAKRDPNNASWRLVFDIPKQKTSYVVTPMLYNWQQNANKPMEIMYNFQLKAWRRIFLDTPTAPGKLSNQPISPGILQTILATIASARQTVSGITNLVQAVTSDLEAPLTVLRQTALFVKDLAGVSATVADLPNQLISDYSSSIASSIYTARTAIASVTTDDKTLAALAAISGVGGAAISSIGGAGAIAGGINPSAISLIAGGSGSFEGLSLAAVQSGQLGPAAAASVATTAASTVFADPASYYELLDQVPISSLSLTNAQQNTINSVIADASTLTVAQLKGYRQQILTLALQLSNSYGTGSAYYDMLYSLPPPTSRLQPITLDEYDTLKSLYDLLASYDILTATTQIDDQNIENAIDYVAGLATTSGIAFTVPTAKILAPVPYGLTIEGIAARYLGDPQQWIVIATLNDLREPYIDEIGFQLPLLSDASGREIVIADITNVYIGQPVILNGLDQPMSPRTVLAIKRISDTSFLITLDGLANLSNFTLAGNAYLQVYMPGTCNSQQKIFIPTTLPVPTESTIVPPAGTFNDPLTAISLVDWLLQDNGDLVVSNYGDFRYSYGITNIIQALRIKFATVLGTCLLEPNFGLGVVPGESAADVQIQDLYNQINNMILQDSRFTGISKLQISLSGPVLAISVAVTIPGQNTVFPVTFALTNT
jgi:hypothetical protein